ncbi:hypothetical protein BRC84_03640 [Halobacteriales archaeon QS_1_68_44]|nr:MAG: hypothetical protein BRC84_03640 [Halobacteriales archaeon QS_1_68_44]
MTVRADDLLSAVLENLLSNAVDHNDADRPRVAVGAEPDGESVVLRVSDNGPGIPESEREAYFEAGRQHEASVGQGLGLYLVNTLVERYGGTVEITDNEPRGTTIEVELRRVDG